MRIIGLVNKDSACSFHRILMPLLLMPDVDTYITNNITEQDFEKGCDAIYYNRVISDEILKLRDKYHFKVVVDIDDYWKLDRHHIAYEHYEENNYEALQIRHLQDADVVTTTHERLAEKIYPYNKNVIICPNAIPKHEYFPVEKTQSERVRIFWQGSITHEKDIELLKNPLRRLDKNKFLMVMAGYTEHEVWNKMASTFTRGLSLQGCILKGLSPFEYYTNYRYADICLAPLVETEFNSYKTNLKVLEAAHSGVPVIASKVDPYLDMPILYAGKQTDWYKHISMLASDEAARREQGEQLQAFCEVNYNFEQINIKRKSQFRVMAAL